MTGRRTSFAATTGRRSAVARDKASRALLAADKAAAEAARPYQGSAAMEALGRFASLGDQPPLRTLCAATIAAGLAGGDRRLARAGLRMLVAHTIATLAKDFVKRRVDRTRPRSNSGKSGDHVPRPGRRTAKEVTSFPSGHSAGAAAVARAFARDYPEYAAPAYAAAGALALAQIPRCAHYPTDVGAGLAIGLAADALTDRVLRSIDPQADPKGTARQGQAELGRDRPAEQIVRGGDEVEVARPPERGDAAAGVKVELGAGGKIGSSSGPSEVDRRADRP